MKFRNTLISATFAALAFLAQPLLAFNETISFNDNAGAATSGSYNQSDTINLDVFLTWTPYSALGLSYWLEVSSALAPAITITDANFFTFPFGAHISNPVLFNSTRGTDPGFTSAFRDLGAGTNGPDAIAAGTYHITTLTLTLSNAAPGTYLLKTTVLPSLTSQISDSDFVSHSISQATYTITIIPEPATWSLVGLGGLGAVAMNWRRSRRK